VIGRDDKIRHDPSIPSWKLQFCPGQLGKDELYKEACPPIAPIDKVFELKLAQRAVVAATCVHSQQLSVYF